MRNDRIDRITGSKCIFEGTGQFCEPLNKPSFLDLFKFRESEVTGKLSIGFIHNLPSNLGSDSFVYFAPLIENPKRVERSEFDLVAQHSATTYSNVLEITKDFNFTRTKKTQGRNIE